MAYLWLCYSKMLGTLPQARCNLFSVKRVTGSPSDSMAIVLRDFSSCPVQRHDNVPVYLSHCSMCPVWQQGSTSLLGHAGSCPQAILLQSLYGCLLAQNSSLAPLWEACFDSAFLHMLLERDTAGVTADNSSLVCSWEIPRQRNQGELLAAQKKKKKRH